MEKLDRTGKKYLTNEGYSIEIIEYLSPNNCTIKFECGFISKNKTFANIKKGGINYPFHKSHYGIGYFGVGNYKSSVNKEKTKSYLSWQRMLNRCYDDKFLIKYPTYVGCLVCDEWHNYQNFAKWYEENYIEDFHLDKDILVKGNKIYSPSTCCFVPNEINTTFKKTNKRIDNLPLNIRMRISKKNIIKFDVQINKFYTQCRSGNYDSIDEAFKVSKKIKEDYIKEVADKWKDKIKPNVYDAMYNYIVEIND